MSDAEKYDASTVEGRVAGCVAELWRHANATEPEIVVETQQLVEMDPDGTARGIRLHYDDDADLWQVVWVGRTLGWIQGEYLRTGQGSP